MACMQLNILFSPYVLRIYFVVRFVQIFHCIWVKQIIIWKKVITLEIKNFFSCFTASIYFNIAQYFVYPCLTNATQINRKYISSLLFLYSSFMIYRDNPEKKCHIRLGFVCRSMDSHRLPFVTCNDEKI